MERIPDDLLKYEVLLRLPATSVVRFMFTCKTYYSLISSDRLFAEAHRQRGRAGDQKVLVVASDRALSLNYNSLVIAHLNLPRTGSTETKDVRIIGSCHGLVCLLLHSKTFVLWNPTTGEFRKLPITLSLSSREKWYYGLGYDSLRCDHKLVVIVNPVITVSNHVYNHCIVDYSLRSGSVNNKCRPNTIDFTPSDKCALYFNHHLHWDGKAFDRDSFTSEVAILTYDLVEEIFSYLPMPDIDYSYFQGITVIKDSFAAFFYSSNHPSFEVWMMKEYKARSWTLIYSFDDYQHFENDPHLWDIHKLLLDISDDGSLVMDNRDHLSIVEPVEGAPSRYRLFKSPPNEDQGLEHIGGARSWIYEESLISPRNGEVSLDQLRNNRVGHKAGAQKRKLDKQLFYKTVICNTWETTGECPFGDYCLFAHGLRQLRTKVCLNVLNGRTCPFGELCEYRHNLTELERHYHEDRRVNNKMRKVVRIENSLH